MSAVLLDGKALSARMRERLGQEAAALPRQPGLAVILVGDNPASAVYVRNKEKDCAQCGVRCLNHHLPAETTQQELLALVEEMNRRADILISAVGRRGLITADMVKPGAVVVDVAMNRNEEGKLCGDVDFAAVAEKAAYITPVPGGVGPMTRAMLMENTISASRRRQRKED